MRKLLTAALLGVPLLIVIAVVFRLSNQGNEPSVQDYLDLGFHKLVIPQHIGELSLPDTKGAQWDIGSQDSWQVIYLGYTHCPSVCPLTMSHFKQAKDRLADIEKLENTFKFILITINPERDRAKNLADYLTSFDKDFIGLIPDPKHVDRVQLQMGLSPLDRSVFEMDHSQHTAQEHSNAFDQVEVAHQDRSIIINPAGKIVGYARSGTTGDALAKILANLHRYE